MSDTLVSKLTQSKPENQPLPDEIMENIKYRIVYQAIDDYRKYSRVIRENRKIGEFSVKRAKKMIREVEQFFNSNWYREICDIPAEIILNKLREENENEQQR